MVRDIPLMTDNNACIVDYSKFSRILFKIAVENMNKVGAHVGEFLLSIQQHIPLNRVSVIGHSLGAHVAGAVGARTGGRISAIFALDPAHMRITIPLRKPSERLDPTDAQFVQVLHTTSGTVGTPFNIGHQDWSADDGKSPQKGCEPQTIFFDPNAFAPFSLPCSHLRALEIFRYALNRNIKFKSNQGDLIYGFWSQRTPGIYNFTTKREPPFV